MGTSLSRSLMHSRSRSLIHSRVIHDPSIRAELYTWLSAEFRDEYALIYTSRSNPSLTCISHYRVNRDKVLLAFYDCLFEGNTVRVDMKFLGDRDDIGRFAHRYAHAEDSSGSFIEKIERSCFLFLRYQDKFKRRIGELELNCAETKESYHQVRFTTGIVGDSLVTYFVYVFCNPLKGLDVDICGPFCEYDDYIRQPIGSCYLNNVSGMPTHDVVKEKKQGNDDVGATDHGSTQRTAILNAGRTQGNFNGSNFRDCKIIVDAQAIQLKDFNNGT